jgi:predicted tellurium resistance membrane protein TerC
MLSDPQAWVSLLTLTVLEVVLSIDNLVVIAVLVGKLPKERQAQARYIGMTLALVPRLVLLLFIGWIIGLTEPWFFVLGHGVSGKDLILAAGGAFLIYKATHEIHDKLEGAEQVIASSAAANAAFAAVILQIMVIDVVFSLDSIITAVGMVDHIEIMVAAIIASVGFMLVFASTIHGFVNRHPTIKMLALAFLMVIGMALIADGFEVHIPRGYIYFAMAFAGGVEFVNVLASRNRRKHKEAK